MTRSVSGGSQSGSARAALVILVFVVAVGAVATPTAAASAEPGPADTTFVVTLAEDGSADVTLRLTFDLDSEEERRALKRLRQNRSDLAAPFHDRLAAIAARTAAETGRNMRISAVAVRISTEGSTGVVEISATWIGLAAVEGDGDRLVVREPFAAGFEPSGRFEIRAPEGYALASSIPKPTTESEEAVAWEAGSSLSGFEATFAPKSEVADPASSQSMPGFGVLAGALAIAIAAGLSALAARKRS